jgi:hypothetical protein
MRRFFDKRAVMIGLAVGLSPSEAGPTRLRRRTPFPRQLRALEPVPYRAIR